MDVSCWGVATPPACSCGGGAGLLCCAEAEASASIKNNALNDTIFTRTSTQIFKCRHNSGRAPAHSEQEERLRRNVLDSQRSRARRAATRKDQRRGMKGENGSDGELLAVQRQNLHHQWTRRKRCVRKRCVMTTHTALVTRGRQTSQADDYGIPPDAPASPAVPTPELRAGPRPEPPAATTAAMRE